MSGLASSICLREVEEEHCSVGLNKVTPVVSEGYFKTSLREMSSLWYDKSTIYTKASRKGRHSQD